MTYDGPDLAEVAELTGLTPDEVVDAHTGTPWRVAFGGFAPGFAYLVGRRPAAAGAASDEPRTRCRPGRSGWPGEFSGVYPRASPGGWQLIGRTEVRCGTSTGNRPRCSAPASPCGSRRHDRPGGPAGGPVLVQDAGRPGQAAIGVGASGAADRASYALANRLVGNGAGAAALEVALGGLEIEAVDGTAWCCVTGAPVAATADGRAEPTGAVLALRPGARLALGRPRRRGCAATSRCAAASTGRGARLAVPRHARRSRPGAARRVGDRLPVGGARPRTSGSTPSRCSRTTTARCCGYVRGPRADWVRDRTC